MAENQQIIEKESVVIKFSGDSGDGMQLTGTLFSNTSALEGNDLSTFPDYPAEIRAPQGTVGGVSGFQLNFGKTEVYHPGDYADVLVAMNPAAVKANMRWVKPNGVIIYDGDSFTKANLRKAGYDGDPLEGEILREYKFINCPITSLTREALKEIKLDNKTILRSKNMFALGLVYWMFHRPLEHTEKYFETKFKNNPDIAEANLKVLRAGYYYGETIDAVQTYRVNKAVIEKGVYRNINGNIATAWGCIAAAEKSGLELFCGSYPITPATDILQELAARKDLGVKSFQAEDEIAGICTAIGASFAGDLAVTTTSGPGLALKAEAIGLAVITELPLVIVNVQRGGPSTGLPTKTEQADLMQALFGRNGESPVVVLAASTPSDCFYYAYIACKIALERMTPVILLTDGFLANGSEPWKVIDTADLPSITPRIAKEGTEYLPYKRDLETMARDWAVPGMAGMEHRIGGLEKMAVTGTVSYVPENHEVMVNEREAKVNAVVDLVPDIEILGDETDDLLVVGWGGTYGHLLSSVKEMRSEGNKIAFAHFNYIKPFPKNTRDVLSKFKKIVVCEINNGQFVNYLRMTFPEIPYMQYNKVQGLPFTVLELKTKFEELLKQ